MNVNALFPSPTNQSSSSTDTDSTSSLNEVLILEVKAVEQLLPVHEAQLLTYLKLTGFPIGLLINFNSEAVKRGLRRMTLK